MSLLVKLRTKLVPSVVSCFIALLLLAPNRVAAQTSVLTHHFDISRRGANTNETILTPANVTTANFGKLFSHSVDGQVYAEPLYVPGVTMAAGTAQPNTVHNVIFVATEHDGVYAFDADSNAGANANPLWQISFLSAAHGAAAGATTLPSSDVSAQDITPEMGITSTPVIDLTTNTMYVVGQTKENGTYPQRLHALDITSGAEKFGGPVTLSASVPGNGTGSSAGTLNFDSQWELNRPGLLLLNGIVYLAFGSHNDNGPWHGWVLAYSASSLQQTGVWCSTPNGSAGGIWLSGGGLAAEVPDPVNHPFGRMFVATGNGTFDAVPPYSNAQDFGDSIVRLDLANGVPTVATRGDDFTPWNQATLNNNDTDLASGAVMLLPDQTTGGHTHLLFHVSKEAKLRLIDRDTMGGYNSGGSSNPQIVQEIAGQMSGVWSAPAYWNGRIYVGDSGSTLYMYPLVNGLISLTGSQSNTIGTTFFPGVVPTISANGTSNGILWSIRTEAYNTPGPSILYAFDATNIKTKLYSSDQNASRDTPGNAVKFTVPTIINGKVYVGTAAEVSVYGLLNGASPAATPVFSPGTETFTTSLQVSIADSTPGASIHYTTDGSNPSPASPTYTGPISVASTTTIQAIATASGYLESPVATATYTLMNQASAPVFSPSPGSYSTVTSVTISSSTTGATIYYTTDGSTPTTSSAKYSGPLSLSSTTTLKAIATANGLSNSPVSSGVYTISLAGVNSINYAGGFASGGMVLNGGSTLNGSRLRLTAGTTFAAASAWYNVPANIQTFTNDFSFQITPASPTTGDGFTFTIQSNSTSVVGPNGGGLGYGGTSPGTQGIASSIAVKFDLYDNAGEGPDSTGLYSNGASPTVPAVNLSTTGINLHSGDVFNVHMAYDGVTLTMTITDATTNATFTTSFPIDIPGTVGGTTAYAGFTAGTGGNTATQEIISWNFNAGTQSAAAPSFSPAAGTYLGTQTVSLTDSTPGAAVYYTTDGSNPTTASAQYSSPIAVSATETIKAIAVAPGYASSAVASATYTIEAQVPAPTFAPPGGSYTGALTVTLSDAVSGATIFYTTDGTTPGTTVGGSTFQYSGPITVSVSETIKAIAIASGYSNSVVSSASYVITSGNVLINYSSGFTPGSLTMNGGVALLKGSTLQLTDARGGEATSVWYNSKVPISSFTTDFSFQLLPGTIPIGDGITFTIQNDALNAVGGAGGGLGYGASPTQNLPGVTNSVAIKFDLSDNAGEGPNSTGIFTNAAAPFVPAVNLTGTGIDLHSTHVFLAHLSYDGTNLSLTITDASTNASFTYSFPINIPATVGASQAYVGFTAGTGGSKAYQNVLNWSFTSASGSGPVQVATPTFSPGGGTYTTAQSVTLSDSTAGASIFYTTDGSTPGTSAGGSTFKFSTPIPVASSMTIKALATASGYSNSNIASASYTINLPQAATPIFSPAGGTYLTAQTVSLSDSTAGAAIYYTTNGATPTTSSTKYVNPITVNSTQTIQAIAAASGFANSTVGSASYTIESQAAAPTFSPLGGTYSGTQTVTISDATSGATIFYTTDGSTPATSAGGSTSQYSAPITVSASKTVKAIATASGYAPSNVSSASYTISSAGAVINFSAGFPNTSGLSLNGKTALSGTRLRLTDGGTWEASSVFSSSLENIQSFTTDFTFQQSPGSNPTADGMTFVIQNYSVAAVGGYGGGLGYGANSSSGNVGFPHSIAVKFDLYDNSGEGPNSTGLYTNSAAPTVPAINLLSSSVNLHSQHLMHAHLSYDGTTLSMTLTDTTTNAVFQTSWPINIPSVVGGNVAYVGFTGATGSATAIQDIVNWTYSTP